MALLDVGIHDLGFGQGLIVVVVDAFEKQATDHIANRYSGVTGMAVKPGKGYLKMIPLDPISQKKPAHGGVNKISRWLLLGEVPVPAYCGTRFWG